MHKRRSIIFIVLLTSLLALGLITPGSGWDAIRSAHAATLTVTNAADSGVGSLRNAVAAALPGDVIVFAPPLSGSTITLTSTQITIGTGISIIGLGASNLTISGNNQLRIFNIPAVAAMVSISGLTLTQGKPSDGLGGGAIYNQANLTVDSMIFTQNTDNAGNTGGGAIFNGNILSVSNSLFTANQTNLFGGAVYNQGTAKITTSTFIANIANESGGGITNFQGTINIYNSTFFQNVTTAGQGGTLYNSSTLMKVYESTLSKGGAPSGGNVATNSGSTTQFFTTIVDSPISGGNCAGPIVTGNYNLSTDFTCAFVAPGDANGVPAGLVPGGPVNNGGPTPTIALQASSLGVDTAGSGPCITPVDQRGYFRPFPAGGKCDKGAYEFGSVSTADTIGLFAPPIGQFFLRNSNSAGPADFIFSYGPAPSGLTPITGDWTGQGIETPGLYDPSTGFFYLKNHNTSGLADIIFKYGPGGLGFIPIVGSWTGTGVDTVGLYDPVSAFFYLHNCNSTPCGTADIVFSYGPPSSNLTPVTGDWIGTGTDTIGLYSPSNAFFYLRNSNTSGPADTVFQFGPANNLAIPITGHWLVGNPTTIGVYVPANAYFYLKNTNAAGAADAAFQYGPGPNAGWLPVTGNWGDPAGFHIAQPGPGQIDGSLGFISNRGGAWGIYRMDGDETHLHSLMTIGKNPFASRPVWSPDGKQIAFASDRDGSSAIYVINADGSNLKRLTWNKALNYQPAWSPDGKRLVYASNAGNSTNLYTMDADGSNIRQLTYSLRDLNEQPVWLPDGSQIAYATGKGTLDIALISVDGKTSKLLTRNGRQPTWSPDGKRIAFVSTRDGNSQLYVMNADGSNIQRLTNNAGQNEMPTWSPDGKRIAFVSTRDGNSQLYVMNADGSNIQRLTNNIGQDQFPVWLPQ